MFVRMMRALIRSLPLLFLAACGSAAAPNESGRPFAVAALGAFDNPWALAFLPDGSALVTEKGGTIRHWHPGGRTAALTGAPKVVESSRGGLLDIVLSPGFASDHLVYLTYSEPQAAGGSGLALARARIDGDRLDGLQVIWRDPAGGSGGQFGGIVAFAPDGKSVFLSSGERQRFTPAQDPSQPVGKILHLTLDGKPAPGNPWAGRAGAAKVTITDPPSDTEEAKSEHGRPFAWPGVNSTPAETWSLGHRNPYGLAFAPDGRLWETEMGPRGGDELNLVLPGRNYGWPLVSEGENYNGVPIPKPASQAGLEPAKLFWVPSVSPTSLVIYSGKLFDDWKGSGLIGTLSGNALIRVTIDGDKAAKADQWDMGARIRFVTEGPDGAVYLLEDGSGGRLLRLTPAK
jgi:glucose/arabinose dehydrogenase